MNSGLFTIWRLSSGARRISRAGGTSTACTLRSLSAYSSSVTFNISIQQCPPPSSLCLLYSMAQPLGQGSLANVWRGVGVLGQRVGELAQRVGLGWPSERFLPHIKGDQHAQNKCAVVCTVVTATKARLAQYVEPWSRPAPPLRQYWWPMHWPALAHSVEQA